MMEQSDCRKEGGLGFFCVMPRCSVVRSSCATVWVAALLLFTVYPTSIKARRGGELFFAKSAAATSLQRQLVSLSPTVDPGEARRVVEVAFSTERQLTRDLRAFVPLGSQHSL